MRFFLLISAGLLLSACTTLDSVEPEKPDLAEHFLADDAATKNTQSSEASWWLAFEDEKLNTLIQIGLANNYSLKASYARLAMARAWLIQ